jgi:hypothetical protein
VTGQQAVRFTGAFLVACPNLLQVPGGFSLVNLGTLDDLDERWNSMFRTLAWLFVECTVSIEISAKVAKKIGLHNLGYALESAFELATFDLEHRGPEVSNTQSGDGVGDDMKQVMVHVFRISRLLLATSGLSIQDEFLQRGQRGCGLKSKMLYFLEGQMVFCEEALVLKQQPRSILNKTTNLIRSHRHICVLILLHVSSPVQHLYWYSVCKLLVYEVLRYCKASYTSRVRPHTLVDLIN